MNEIKVWKTMAIIGGRTAFCDMIYIDGIPHLVLEWEEDAANEYPSRTVPLDPIHLQLAPGSENFDFVYGPSVDMPDSEA